MMKYAHREKTLHRCCYLGLSLCISVSAHSDSVHVAVASNFIAPLKDIAEHFQQDTLHQVIVSNGASGKLTTQIMHGAPYDVFLSADTDKPEQLIDRQLALSDSQFTYAIGQLVAWAPNSKDTLSDLKEGKFRKIALANALHAPYGKAAEDILSTLGVIDVTKPHWVVGENISQTYQFVASGNADMGFVAYSQLHTQLDNTLGAQASRLHKKFDNKVSNGSVWLIPAEMHTPILQNAVLLVHGQHNQAAQAFMRYLQSENAHAIIKRYGYRLPVNQELPEQTKQESQQTQEKDTSEAILELTSETSTDTD
ncbi:MAG: molybdate ABC transporter substrate-binding protein [Oleibacter sp.]|nr:molybdate ABC transporter substrate-binding protein [Thalassolituus sp.]